MAATVSESKATSEHQEDSVENAKQDDHVQQAGWKLLFGFTTRKHLPILCGAIFAATIAAATLPAMAVLFGLLFRQFADYGAGKISGALLLHNTSEFCIYLTAVCTLCWFANSFYFALFLAFSELQARSARERVFGALLRKNMEWYDTRENGIAAYLPSLQSQVRDLQLATSVPLGESVQTAVIGIGALAVAFYFSWNLTLVTLCTMPLVYLVMTFFSGRLSKHAHKQADTLQQALKYITNAVTNIETVKCFNGERSELQRYSGVIARAGALHRRLASFRSAQIGIMQFYTLSIFFQGFLYGSYLVTSGKTNPGNVVTTFWTSLMAMNAITEFLPQLIILQKGKVAAARLRTTMDQISVPDRNETNMRGVRPGSCAGRIEFQQVSFSYPTRPQEPALRGATITSPAGQTTFVVGRSGSGKSTLGQLLVRFYNPGDGQILLDGISLEQLDFQWLRENITLVEQHSVLFKDSIRANIALASQDGPPMAEDIEHATYFALLQQVLKDLPDGLDTVVGTKGNSLSGGQRQRVALARARLRDTPILILDESTSALDYLTRSGIVEAIRNWRQGKTTIIITHDVTQIQSDDYVYVLDKAQVVQEGYRADLEAQKDSAFQTFLASEPDRQQASDDSAETELEEVVSAYSRSWAGDSWAGNTWAGSRRGSIEIQVGPTIMPPFMSPGRSSLYRRSVLADTSLTSPFVDLDSEKTSRRSSLPTADLEPGTDTETFLKMRPLPTRAAAREGERGRPPLSSILSESLVHTLPQGTRSSSRIRELPPYTRTTSPGSLRPLRPASLRLDPPSEHITHTLPRHREKFLKRMLKRRGQAPKKPAPVVNTLTILEILKTFWPNLDWRSRIGLITAIFCAVMHAAVTPSFGYVFARLLSTFYAASNQYRQALIYALAILGIAIVDGLVSYGFQFLFDSCAQTWANSIKAEALRRILLQPREFFDREENDVSRIAECLDSFGEEARNLPGRFVGVTIVVVVMILIAIVWCMISCWKLTLVALATGPVLYAVLTAYNAISSRWETRSNEADEHVGQVLHETFVNIKTVRCLVLEEVFRTKYDVTTKTALKIGFKRAIYTGSIFGINYSGVFFVSTLCFWFGAYLLSLGEFSVTAVLQTFTILLLSSAHATFIINYIPQIHIARDAGSRLLRLARLPITSHELKGTTHLGSAGDIHFCNTSFSYPTRPGQKVLDNITLHIPRGSCTAIVGPSGSGKSTIASLLLKLYEPSPFSSPTLRVSSQDISELHTASLRARISLVSQSPVLFPGTVAENIAYGLSPSSPMASIASIRRAAGAAGIDEFIASLPQGYSTVIGEGGAGLSGGQAQRIAIARALVREPDVLVLDEATSALDVESAGVVRDTVVRLVEGRTGQQDGKGKGRVGKKGEGKKMTVVLITHAREMMAVAEKVVMLEKGVVVEEGGFEELKRKRGGQVCGVAEGEEYVC